MNTTTISGPAIGSTTGYNVPDARKKICMISYLADPSYLPNMYHGGVSMRNMGFDVMAICTSSKTEYMDSGKKDPGFPITMAFLYSRKFFHQKFGLATKNVLVAALQYFLTYTEFIIKAAYIGWRTKADIYEPHDLPALLPAVIAARLRRKPVVYHAHELYAEMHEKVRFAGFWKFLERWLIRSVERVVTPEDHRSTIYFREFKTRRFPLTVRNCPPYKTPIQSDILRRHLRDQGIVFEKIVLYQGLFDTSRCIEELTAAMKYVDPGIVLVLIGGGFKEWQAPKETVNVLNKVVVVPRIDYNDLPGYTASADIGVLFYRNNCRNNYYCAPNKLHEYMMMGLPVITCNYPGMTGVVERERVGICVNPEQPREIAQAINTIAGNSSLYREMKNNCLRLSREVYNWENEVRKIYSEYFNVLRIQPEYKQSVLRLADIPTGSELAAISTISEQ